MLLLIELGEQSMSKKYKWFNNGFSDISPLDKLLAQFNTIQKQNIQKLFSFSQTGQQASEMFRQY